MSAPKTCARAKSATVGGAACGQKLYVFDGWWTCSLHGRITQHGLPTDDDVDDLAGERHEQMEQFDRDRQEERDW